MADYLDGRIRVPAEVHKVATTDGSVATHPVNLPERFDQGLNVGMDVGDECQANHIESFALKAGEGKIVDCRWSSLHRAMGR